MTASGLDESIAGKRRKAPASKFFAILSCRECLSCHNSRSSGVLGFTLEQLNKETDYGRGPVTHPQALIDDGFCYPPLKNANLLPALDPLDDSSQRLEYRVRSYPEANSSTATNSAAWRPCLGIRKSFPRSETLRFPMASHPTIWETPKDL